MTKPYRLLFRYTIYKVKKKYQKLKERKMFVNFDNVFTHINYITTYYSCDICMHNKITKKYYCFTVI